MAHYVFWRRSLPSYFGICTFTTPYSVSPFFGGLRRSILEKKSGAAWFFTRQTGKVFFLLSYYSTRFYEKYQEGVVCAWNLGLSSQ